MIRKSLNLLIQNGKTTKIILHSKLIMKKGKTGILRAVIQKAVTISVTEKGKLNSVFRNVI